MPIDWKYTTELPRFRFLRVDERLPTFVTADQFVAIMTACHNSKLPCDMRNITPEEWWQGLLVTLYMTGWRIAQTLRLKWEDVDLVKMKAVSRASDNKGGRDIETPLHPLIIEYLKPLAGSFREFVFPWDHNSRTLWTQFGEIQAATVIDGKPLAKGGKNGGWFGFHDLRRGYATLNAEHMDLFELQRLMQHKSLETTKGYVHMAKKLNKAVSNLFVPDLRKGETG